MSEHTTQIIAHEVREDVHLAWTVHLARKAPKKSAAAVAVTIFAVAMAYFAISAFGALAVAIVMLAALADFFFPVKYVIDNDAAEARMLFKAARIEWKDVRRAYMDDYGIKLSPLPRLSRLEAFRGVYLRFADNRDTVMQIVKRLKDQSECTA